jgi:hypothetical protein
MSGRRNRIPRSRGQVESTAVFSQYPTYCGNLVSGHLKSSQKLIHEQFGDGIMSAIDFTMDIEKVNDPNGNRVKVTMCGKFLPYKSW